MKTFHFVEFQKRPERDTYAFILPVTGGMGMGRVACEAEEGYLQNTRKDRNCFMGHTVSS